MGSRNHEVLLEVGALPTAPFVEGMVNGYIHRFVASRGHLRLEVDRWGNRLVHYARGRARARTGPLWLSAHTDHPGFVAERMTGRDKLRARWFGGVGIGFFKDADVRFYVTAHGGSDPDGERRVERIVPGRITSVVAARHNAEARPHLRRRPQAVYVEVAEPVPPGTPGMWYLPDPKVVGQTVPARAHDDLAQVAALLCMLDELEAHRIDGHVTCAFTRAEEVGFAGAIGLARDKALPSNATFISLECSDARAAGVRLGDGPILRVGDLTTTFDQSVLAWMGQVARGLSERDGGFRVQRKLMPGGSCESTPLEVFGYATGAMCLPLDNYHNIPAEGSRVASEVIDLRDFDGEVAWLVALVERGVDRAGANRELARRLNARFREHRPFMRMWGQ